MINSILDAVSIALDTEFNGSDGDAYEIHTEEIKQGLVEPCFFVACLKPTTDQFLGKRYFNTYPLCIQYFPSTDKKQRECNDVAERMTDCLEYITTLDDNAKIRGTNMKHEVIDGVLNFFINYDLFTYKVEDSTPMETMESSTTVKEGD